MFKIKISSEDYPTVSEAQKAAKEADILSQQAIELFLSKPVKHVLFELSCRYRNEKSPFLMLLNVFNYGYILGKRAERARQRQTAQDNTNCKKGGVVNENKNSLPTAGRTTSAGDSKAD